MMDDGGGKGISNISAWGRLTAEQGISNVEGGDFLF